MENLTKKLIEEFRKSFRLESSRENSDILNVQCLKDRRHYMHYDEENNRYICPHCNAYGDALSITLETISKSENEIIAEKTNTNTQIYFEMNEMINEEFLKQRNEIKNYLMERKIKEETSEKWEFGYSGHPRKIADKMLKNFSENELLEGGLLHKTDSGIIIPFFGYRMMLPIRNKNKKIVGFGGRILKEAGQRKYLNSPETPIFKKSEVLYGIDKIPEWSDEIYIVEGFMDVIAMESNGIKPVVGTLGTALTKRHYNILKTKTPKQVLIFDGDTAGQESAKRVLSHIAKTSVCSITGDAKDPDEYIKKYGKENFEKFIKENTLSWMDFWYENFNKNDEEKDIMKYLLQKHPNF